MSSLENAPTNRSQGSSAPIPGNLQTEQPIPYSSEAESILASAHFTPVRELLRRPAEDLTAIPDAMLEAVIGVIEAKESKLQSEIVWCDGFHPPGARRSSDDWSREWAGFTQIRDSVAGLLTTELERRRLLNLPDPVQALSHLVDEAIKRNDRDVLRLMKLHSPEESHEFFDSDQVRARELAAVYWEYPHTDPTKAEVFLHAVRLEREERGSGVRLLVSSSPGAERDVPSQNDSTQGIIQRGVSLLTRLPAILREDWFQIPRFWAGEFSFIKPVHRRKVTLAGPSGVVPATAAARVSGPPSRERRSDETRLELPRS